METGRQEGEKETGQQRNLNNETWKQTKTAHTEPEGINAGENRRVFASRDEMGRAAASAVEDVIETLLCRQREVRMIFAAAPSQQELLHYLSISTRIAWDKVVAFHMDEYIGLSENDPASFGSFLNTHLFHKVPFKKVHLMGGSVAGPVNPDPASASKEVQPLQYNLTRYAGLLQEAPIDIVCLGIGENGHLAFNDPPVADFNDPEVVKIVTLDQACREQQVHDGMFATLDEVPKKAITLTIPALLSARYLFCVVPGITKQKAVYATFREPVSESCPATILRQLPAGKCTFYFDKQAFALLEKSSG